MNRLTDHDKTRGPFTLAPWKNSFAAYINSGDGGDDDDNGNRIMLIAFGWALRIAIPTIIQPWREKYIATSWDEETVKRMGRDWYYNVFPREYGFTLSNMGNGYDFLQVYLGAQTHSSETTQNWCTHLPWKQWDCVRSSVYEPDGTHFATEQRGEGRDFREWSDARDKCPAAHFGFEDFDGEMIIATCKIEEREWHRGEGWFKWLKWFYPRKIRRSLDLHFSAEVGPEKGSWKGGTIGHGIDMEPGETPQQAFERYCQKEHDARHGRKFRIRFIGPCGPPPPRPKPQDDAKCNAQAQAK